MAEPRAVAVTIETRGCSNCARMSATIAKQAMALEILERRVRWTMISCLLGGPLFVWAVL